MVGRFPGRRSVNPAIAQHIKGHILEGRRMRFSIMHLAEALAMVKQSAASSRVKKSAIELSDEAAARIRNLLETRHKVRDFA